jgi:hypothetical protein
MTPLCPLCGSEMLWETRDHVQCAGSCSNRFAVRELTCQRASCRAYVENAALFPTSVHVRVAAEVAAQRVRREC